MSSRKTSCLDLRNDDVQKPEERELEEDEVFTNDATNAYECIAEISPKKCETLELSKDTDLSAKLSASELQMSLSIIRSTIEDEMEFVSSNTRLLEVEKKMEFSMKPKDSPSTKKERSCHDVANDEEWIVASSRSRQSVYRSRKSDETIAARSPDQRPPSMSTDSFLLSQDVLQISASMLSNDSPGLKSEIFSLSTDYANGSPDSHSIVFGIVDQGHSSTIPNRNIRVPVEDAWMFPTRNRLRTSNEQSRRWKFIHCLRCTSNNVEETDMYPYLRGAPPTYSSIHVDPPLMPDQRRLNVRPTNRSNYRRLTFLSTNQSSFTAPTPPPSYAQAQGICFSPPNAGHWSSRPTTAICPRCMVLVITVIQVRQTAIAHFVAATLFLCGCWPCCMIPYCVNSCKNTDHYCPICHAYLGTYTPW